MIRNAWWKRFLVRGVFWRQFLRWAVLNVPLFIEPIVEASWTLFFLLWGPGRRGVMRNLTAIKPGSSALVNFLRTYRVFWNFAWTITDTVRFKELHVIPDWEFTGWEHFKEMESRPEGAIILTAHMGSYDLGVHLFAEMSERRIMMIRAPERDERTREYEAAMHERTLGQGLRINFNTKAAELAFELLEAVNAGKIVAIQGDRVTEGIGSFPAKLFGKPTLIPSGPFALAMAARVRIYPLFVVRLGRRRYRLITCPPIEVVRRSRNRDEDLAIAVAAWTERLEQVIRETWYQWFTFEPFAEDLA
ncbi:MAG TPA: lysophospholipid acyltransferase family protein [Thermoanaerobaculia bacterium]|nr:lysophospholipid acyltransferase family protein [Thermoanaerobaculia bacterium]